MDQLAPSVFPSFQRAGQLDANIGTIAQQCRALLRACLELNALKQGEWAENRLAEFNLWTASSGVFASDRASLDSRLALQPEVKKVIVGLLTVLIESLTQCQYYGMEQSPSTDQRQSQQGSPVPEAGTLSSNSSVVESNGEEEEEDDDDECDDKSLSPPSPQEIPRAFSPWSDDDSSSASSEEELVDLDSPTMVNSLLDVPKAEVSRIIDHLTRLSLAIRKAGSSSRSHKADRRFNPEDHPGLRRHLNIVVLARGTKEGRSDYVIDTNRLTTVQERLIVANLRRRNRFLYAQRHAIKLAAEATTQTFQEDLRLGEDWPVPIEDRSQEEPKEEDNAIQEVFQPEAPDNVAEPIITETPPKPAAIQPPILSATSASAVTQTIDPGLIHNATPSQVAKTEITTTTAKITYPKPPRLVPGVAYFKCPCCCQTLPEMYRQTSMWKKHLMADICPYTCIIEDCPTPNTLFVTRHEWMRHVEKDHQQCWQCFPCTTAGKAPLIFPSVEMFIDHLRELHAETIKEEQYSTLIPSAARPVPTGISCCPLCDSTGPADSAPLLNHIAEHIHAFSLRSLPWPRCDAVHGDTHDGGDGDDSHANDDEVNGNYFLSNDYFDQGSDVASRQYNLTSGSDRDSDGLPSLHSSQNSVRPSTASEAGSVTSELPPKPDSDLASEDLDSKPVIPLTYDPSRGVPVELDPLSEAYGDVTTPGPQSFLDVIDSKTMESLQSLFPSMARKAGAGWYAQRLENQFAIGHTLASQTEKPFRDSPLPWKELAEGDWPQTCPQSSIASEDGPEMIALRERMLQCMQENYKRKMKLAPPEASSREPSQISSQPVLGDDDNMETFHQKPYVVRARILEQRGRLDEAIPMMTLSVEKCRNELGLVHPKRMEYLEILISMYKSAGLHKGCKELLDTEADSILSYVDDYGIGGATISLDATEELGLLLEAHSMVSRAQELHETVFGAFGQQDLENKPYNELEMRAKGQLADFRGRVGDGKLACTMRREILAANQEELGLEHNTTLESQIALAMLYWRTKVNRSESVRLLEDVVKKQCMMWHFDVVSTEGFTNLGRIYTELGEPTKAAEVYHALLDILKHDPEKNETEMVSCLFELARIYSGMGEGIRADQAWALARWLNIDVSEREGSRPSSPTRLEKGSKDDENLSQNATSLPKESRRSRMLRFFRRD